MFCGSGGSKSRLAKAAGAEPSGEMRDEKLHAVVVQSTCRSENATSTYKHNMFGQLLEVERLKKCTPSFWHEAHFQVNMYKALQVRSTFGSSDAKKLGALLEVQMSNKCTPLWREAHFEVKM